MTSTLSKYEKIENINIYLTYFINKNLNICTFKS